MWLGRVSNLIASVILGIVSIGGYGVVDDESKKFATDYILNKDCSDGELGIAVKTAFYDGKKYIEFQNKN